MDDEYFICTNCHGSGTIRVTTIEKDATLVSKDRLRKLEEKAGKWDDYQEKIMPLWDKAEQIDSTYTPGDIIEWREKARKWDFYTEKIGNWHFGAQDLEEYIEKARKWDEFMSNPKLNYCVGTHRTIEIRELGSLREKARKWDEYSNDLGLYKEIKDKAKKLDEIKKLLGH